MRALKSIRGSVLLTVMLFSLALAIFLTSYIQISLNALKLSQRSFYANAAMNLVDLGLEQAMWSANNSNWTGFAARSGHAGEYQGTFPSSTTYYNLSGGVKGQVKVWTS